MHDFSTALHLLKDGHLIARSGWNGRGMWVRLHSPVHHPKRLPYLEMQTVQGDLIPWLASQADLLAEDWVVSE